MVNHFSVIIGISLVSAIVVLIIAMNTNCKDCNATGSTHSVPCLYVDYRLALSGLFFAITSWVLFSVKARLGGW